MAASIKNVAGRLSHKLLRVRPHVCRYACAYSTETSLQDVEDVSYPPVKPKYPPGSWSEDIPRYLIWRHYEVGQSLLEKGDVRERLEYIAGAKPKPLILTSSWDRFPRTLDYKRFITRSNVLDGLPDVYSKINPEAEYKTLKPLLMDIIVQEHEYVYKYMTEKKKLLSGRLLEYEQNRLVLNIFDTIFRALTHKYKHLQRAQYDRNVRLETCWRLTGFEDAAVRNSLGRIWMQYKGKRAQQIRTELPLPEFLPMDSDVCLGGDLPTVDYPPKSLGQATIIDRPITVAGHWIGDPCEFIHLSVEVLNVRYRQFMNKHGGNEKIVDEAWKQSGLTSGFATCMAQAHNLGFNIYHDLTYPFTTQTVITDGRLLQLFTYQLNTMHMWQTREANPRNNIVWVGRRHQMYEDIKDGKIIGFNDEAFLDLLKFIVMETVDRGYDLRPYVSEEHSPAKKRLYINHKGEEPLPYVKIGRFQYPSNAVYF